MCFTCYFHLLVCVLWQGGILGLPMHLTFDKDIQSFVSCVLYLTSNNDYISFIEDDITQKAPLSQHDIT